MRNAWNELHVGASQLGFRSSNSTVGQLCTRCQRMLRWSRGSARHTGSLGSVSTPTRERLFWQSFRLRWLSLVWKGWEDSRAVWRVFSRGKLTVGVGSSSGFLYWNMLCVVPCSVRPSFVYSWKSRLSNANCVSSNLQLCWYEGTIPSCLLFKCHCHCCNISLCFFVANAVPKSI